MSRENVEIAQRAYDWLASVYALISGTGKQSGATLTISTGHLLTLRDGRIARFEIFLDRPEALRAAGLAE
ncbi:MAG TPA: hypothetical protein VKG38_08075 [Solirubrobacteraceae bacterium]|nr:hypothetical protein [Solirubrobacteraceae bacterium]